VQTVEVQTPNAELASAVTTLSRTERPAVVDAIRNWANDKGYLSQTDVQMLRDSIFAAIDAFVNWDALGVQKKEVCSPMGGLFAKTSINFERMQTQKTQKAIMLELPLPGREQQTAIALEALVLSRLYGSFDYPGGALHLAYFANELQEWSRVIEEQLEARLHGTDQWDPVAACVELLVLAGLQCRYIKAGDSSDQMFQQILQRSDCPPLIGETNDFTRLNEKIAKTWKRNQELLRTLCSVPKGGRIGNIVRAAPIFRAIHNLRKQRFRLEQQPPAGPPVATKQAHLIGRLASLADLYSQVREPYGVAIAAEREAWLSWQARITQQLGSDVRISQFISVLEDTMRRAEDFAAGVSVSALREQLQQLEIRKSDQALDHARALTSATDGEALYRIAVASQGKSQIDNLVAKAVVFLDSLDQRLSANQREMETRVGEGLKQSQEEIDCALTHLIDATSALKDAVAG
jgi:hypothetical protein